MAASAIRKIKYKARCRDANKARGEAECFIGHRGSVPSALIHIARAIGHALSVLIYLEKTHPFQYTRRYPLLHA